jgi:hypothetical protein
MWGRVSEPGRVVITGMGCVTPIGIGRKAWLEGPPAFAPALFTGFAAVGLIAIYFL